MSLCQILAALNWYGAGSGREGIFVVGMGMTKFQKVPCLVPREGLGTRLVAK